MIYKTLVTTLFWSIRKKWEREKATETNDRDKCQWHYWNLVFCYSQTIYTRKENIDFDLPLVSFIHSLTCLIYLLVYILKVRESDRQTADLFLQCFRENYRKRTKCILFITLSVPVHCLLHTWTCMNGRSSCLHAT